ncbi:MAG: hypothetical protein AAB538_02525 [Patescibacteria group bacterium]
MADAKVKIGDAFRFGWQIFKSNIWFLIGVTLVQFLLPRLASPFMDTENEAMRFTILVISVGLSMLLSIGAIKIALALVDGKRPEFAELFRHYRFIARYFGLSLIYSVIITAGFVLLIIPGIYWALKYQFAAYFVVDKNLGVFEAFHRSADITRGVKWPLFQFMMVQIPLNLLGFLALGVGLLVTIPVTMLAYGKIYRDLEKGSVPTVAPPSSPATPAPSP